MIKWQYKPLHFSSSRSLIESELVEELAQKPFGARRLKPCVAGNRLPYSTGASVLSFLLQESNGACYTRQFQHQRRKNLPLLSQQLLRLAGCRDSYPAGHPGRGGGVSHINGKQECSSDVSLGVDIADFGHTQGVQDKIPIFLPLKISLLCIEKYPWTYFVVILCCNMLAFTVQITTLSLPLGAYFISNIFYVQQSNPITFINERPSPSLSSPSSLLSLLWRNYSPGSR